jgi:hypothetical protein
MKTVMGIPKTAKHPTKKGGKAMSGTSLGWFVGGKRIRGRPEGVAGEGLPDILGDMAFLCLMI